MISFVAGVVVGAGAVAAKDFFSGEAAKTGINQKNELEQLYAENEKLRNRVRDAERRVEDLMAEKQKMSSKLKEKVMIQMICLMNLKTLNVKSRSFSSRMMILCAKFKNTKQPAKVMKWR